MAFPATQIREGMVLLMDGELFKVVNKQHVTPGKGRGMVQTKLRRISTGTTHDHRFRSNDQVERAVLERQEMEFLYSDNVGYHFMNSETYEQLSLSETELGETVQFLLPNVKMTMELHEGRPVAVDPPMIVEMKVVKTTPRMKGATVSNQNKPATLETGLTVNVPPFIEQGEMIRVDTRDCSYIERVK